MIKVEVKTITTCDRCGDIDERQGEHPEPPEGWANFGLNYRKANGESDHMPELILCPTCAAAVEEYAKTSV